MPNYNYRCTECGHAWEEHLPMARFDEPCQSACPHCHGGEGDVPIIERYLPSSPGVSYVVGDGVRKQTPDAFKDLLRNIKKQHHGSTIDI